jgi:hypothetical protein
VERATTIPGSMTIAVTIDEAAPITPSQPFAPWLRPIGDYGRRREILSGSGPAAV